MRGLGLKIVCVLLVCMAMFGCRPRGVLSNREMRDLLYDLHRTDGALQVIGYNYGHNKELSAYYQSVLDKHGITQAQFDSSLVWFTDNPQIFNKIYPNVIARLQAALDYEEELRNERIEQRKKEKGTFVEDTQPTTPKIVLRAFEEVQDEYLFGIKNPWKEWGPKDFCEKDVIIFGQLEKK